MGWATRHIETLRAGRTAVFRPHGNSMRPHIESGQLCTVVPIDGDAEINVGEIVLCTSWGRQFLHRVSALRGEQFQISNAKGHVNGWVNRNQIHGRLTRVDP